MNRLKHRNETSRSSALRAKAQCGFWTSLELRVGRWVRSDHYRVDKAGHADTAMNDGHILDAFIGVRFRVDAV
jgi:hypothetical protein